MAIADSPSWTIERLTGLQIEPHLEALARLRIEVFREFPYLYHGSLAHEASYLRDFAKSSRSTLVLARVGALVVGAATAVPLLDHGDAVELAAPLLRAGYDPSQVYYFGESVLTRAQRGRGIGHAFFDQREAQARDSGFERAAFCAVDRPRDHPARPTDYVAHDAFWTRRGFTRRADLVANFSWQDLGHAEETEKPMVFWLKELTS